MATFVSLTSSIFLREKMRQQSGDRGEPLVEVKYVDQPRLLKDVEDDRPRAPDVAKNELEHNHLEKFEVL